MLTTGFAVSLALMMVAEPDDNCFARVPDVMPAPSQRFMEPVDLHQRPRFLFRAGLVTQPVLVEAPVRPNTIGREYRLSAEGEQFIAEGVVYEHFTTPELPLGVCFQMLERGAGAGDRQFTPAYQATSLCVTERGAPAAPEPSTPSVEVQATPATYGTPGTSSGFIDRAPSVDGLCGQSLVVGSGNVTVTVSGVTTGPGAVLVELLSEGQPQVRDLLMHDQLIASQQPLIVKYRASTAQDLRVRVTHRVLGGATGEPVEVDVQSPGSCQHLPTSSLVLLISLAALRRRRELS
ncbi:MAG: hypothetical protein VYB65_12975 [Myxococcota bacterium]|nr:hypothetical protein [Myxococcota bacterium]